MNNINNIIPKSCISFLEQSKYINLAIAENYNMFISNIGINEITNYQENSSDLSYTGENLESLKESISTLHEYNMSIINEAYLNIIDEFESMIKNFNDLDIDIDSIKDGSICKVHEFFDFDKLNFASNAKVYLEKVYSLLDNTSKNNLPDLFTECENYICSKVSGIPNVNTVNEMNAILRKELVGKSINVDKYFVESNLYEINNILESDIIISNIVESMNDELGTVNYFIETIDSLDENSLNYSSYLNKLACLVESVMTNCYFVAFDAYKRMINEYRNIYTKSNSVLNEFSIIKSRKSKIAHMKRKAMGADVSDSVKRNKEIVKQQEKFDKEKEKALQNQ